MTNELGTPASGARSGGGRVPSALRHGMTSATALLPDEDPNERKSFEEFLRGELCPEGPLEEIYFARAESAAWRLRRVERIESGILVGAVAQHVRDSNGLCSIMKAVGEDERLREAQANGWDGPLPDDASERLVEARRVQGSALVAIGEGFTKRAQGLDVLARYEASLDRVLQRALAELRALQGLRRMQTSGLDSQE